MKKVITVLTATRAEFGLLKPIIKALLDSEDFSVRIVVTGAHLAPEFGLTYQEIENEGFSIDKKIEILLCTDTPVSISKSMGLAMIGFADYFEEHRPDALLVLGDRYEVLAVCAVAVNTQIPIIHLYGGETTEGAIDEAIRHSLTKMSYLHFTSTEQYRRRVIQLGESPDRVYTVGAIGIENALNLPLMAKKELQDSLSFDLDRPYAVVTFHPVTLEHGMAEKQCREMLQALELHSEMNYIITKANADVDGRIINSLLEQYEQTHNNVVVFDSLGVLRYLSALKYATMVIGNSSSGLTEVPSFHIPTINIGDRQKGRIQAESVINCRPVCGEIARAIEVALTDEFQKKVKTVTNPYGDGDTSKKIVNILKEKLLLNPIELKKKFYDVEFNY